MTTGVEHVLFEMTVLKHVQYGVELKVIYYWQVVSLDQIEWYVVKLAKGDTYWRCT